MIILLISVTVNSIYYIFVTFGGEKLLAALTDFGKMVKIRLIEIGKPQKWLIDEVKKRTNLYFDDSYLHRISTGKYENPKIIEAIKTILEMD